MFNCYMQQSAFSLSMQPTQAKSGKPAMYIPPGLLALLTGRVVLPTVELARLPDPDPAAPPAAPRSSIPGASSGIQHYTISALQRLPTTSNIRSGSAQPGQVLLLLDYLGTSAFPTNSRTRSKSSSRSIAAPPQQVGSNTQTPRETAAMSVPRSGLGRMLFLLDVPGVVELPDGTIFPTGSGDPAFRVIFRSKRALRTPMTEMSVGRAFLNGDIDVEGDLSTLFDARNKLRDKVPLRQKLRYVWDNLWTTRRANFRLIRSHYGRDDSFYLSFLDKRYRLYSHALFKSPTDSLEDAAENKLGAIFSQLGLQEGTHILDIGGGWGGVAQYCASRGVRVTTITLAENGADYIRNLIIENDLLAEVRLEDFFDHEPAELYDHAVSLSSIEHMPDYRRFARKAWDLLKPGGRLYLDSSAAVEKYDVSAFARDYIWRGTHTYMTVQDVVAELLYHGFELLRIEGETKNYHLTMLEWARRLEEAKDAIIAGWGEETYRLFRLMLWGGQHSFKVNALQAYHLVVQKTNSRGPRPSSLRRFVRKFSG
ncbi:hypothetical protein E4U16_002112 [Claviceps sp. LM84 group G4]|nr:hypothetical protein E4U16_002112 [Claviceps sp. LM84 group G4]